MTPQQLKVSGFMQGFERAISIGLHALDHFCLLHALDQYDAVLNPQKRDGLEFALHFHESVARRGN